MKLDKFLRRALPKKRHEDRGRIYHWFVRESLAGRLSRQPTDAEFAAEMALMRKKEFSDEEFNFLAPRVRLAAAMFKTRNFSKRGKVAALKRWSKK